MLWDIDEQYYQVPENIKTAKFIENVDVSVSL